MFAHKLQATTVSYNQRDIRYIYQIKASTIMMNTLQDSLADENGNTSANKVSKIRRLPLSRRQDNIILVSKPSSNSVSKQKLIFKPRASPQHLYRLLLRELKRRQSHSTILTHKRNHFTSLKPFHYFFNPIQTINLIHHNLFLPIHPQS